MIRNTSVTNDHHDYIPCEFSFSVNYSPRNATFRGIVSKLNGYLDENRNIHRKFNILDNVIADLTSGCRNGASRELTL